MEQLFFAGKAYLKINSLVKTPLHEFMAVERSGLLAPVLTCLHRNILCMAVMLVYRAWLYFGLFINKLSSRMVFFLKKSTK